MFGIIIIAHIGTIMIYFVHGKTREPGGLPRMFIVALVGLCYTIFKGKRK